MSGRKKRYLHSANIGFNAEGQDNFVAFARHSRLHQTSGPFRNDDLAMWRNVIAVGVGNESKGFCVPRIEPEILRRQEQAAIIAHIDHAKNLRCWR